MIDVSTFTKALETLLNTNTTLDAVNATIKRGEIINSDPGNCPWVGIYPGTTVSVPHTIGSGSSRWLNKLDLQVVIQTSSLDGDGQAASDELETFIKTVLSVVNGDLTLAIAGTRVVGVSRDYRYVVFDDNESGDLFMPQVLLKISMEVRSS